MKLHQKCATIAATFPSATAMSIRAIYEASSLSDLCELNADDLGFVAKKPSKPSAKANNAAKATLRGVRNSSFIFI